MPIYKKTINNKVKFYAKINYKDDLGNYKSKQSKYFDTKREAVDEEIRLKIYEEKAVPHNLTFNALFDEYLEKQKDSVKPQSVRKYPPLFKHIKENIGNLKINNLTIQKYNLFKKEIDKKGLSTVYKNKIHNLLKTLNKHSFIYYGIKSDVFEKVGGFKNPSELKKEMQFFTFDEFNKFIELLKDNLMHKTFFETLYFLGLRLGEASALTWNDIDLKQKTIKINKTITSKIKGVDYFVSSPKTKTSMRVLPLENALFQSFEKLLMFYSPMPKFSKNWFVFGGIKPFKETTITKLKNEICKKANLKQIRMHDFRHSCASYYIQLGASPLLLSKLLGHSKVSITLDTYSHLYPNEIDNIIKLSEQFKNGNKIRG